jgi:hypothetical protein
MKNYFEPQNKTLLVIIPIENCSFSKTEYVSYWTEILIDVDIYKPNYLLIDTTELCYRRLPEVEYIFNDISSKIEPGNMALVKCNNIYGRYTFETLLQNCPVKGHTVLNDRNDGIIWLNARESELANQPISL